MCIRDRCRVTEIAVPGDRLQVCLEAKGIDSKQLVCPDTGSFIEQGKKQLDVYKRQPPASYGGKCAHIFSAVDSHLPIQDFRWKSPHNLP